MKKSLIKLMVPRKGVPAAVCPLLLVSAVAYADSGGASASGGMSPMLLLFLAFLGAIILLQLLPALVLFSSLLVAVFKRGSKSAGVTGSRKV